MTQPKTMDPELLNMVLDTIDKLEKELSDVRSELEKLKNEFYEF